MPMFNLIEYSDNYLKKSGSSWQYCREGPALDGNGDNDDNFWRTFETPLINCEVNLMSDWGMQCVISSNNASNQAITFAITDAKV